MNKFIKKNIFMVAFMAVSLIAAIALLIMVFYQHESMKQYDAKKQELVAKIDKIFKQKYTPVQVNVTRISKDIKRYNKEAQKVQSKFGHPYDKALKAFADSLSIPLEDFKTKFSEYWDSKLDNLTRSMIFRSYKIKRFSKDFPRHTGTWKEAMAAFMREAQKVTLEKVTEENVDGIFLGIIGKGRMFSGSPKLCQKFMSDMRNTMLDYFEKKKINCEAADDFSFNLEQMPSELDLAAIATSWEIVADLCKRIADSKIDKKASLALVEFKKRGLVPAEDGEYKSYRFDFTVSGDIATIRRIVTELYKAYADNRVYAIRNIELERLDDNVDRIIEESDAVKEADLDYESEDPQARGITGMPPEGADFRRDSRGRARSTARRSTRYNQPLDPTMPPGANPSSRTASRSRTLGRKKPADKENTKPLKPRDPGYAKVVVGANNMIKAKFEVDYIVYKSSN